MKFGHFDDQKREYVITNPRTPYQWINYLGCEEFFSIVTNTAGGYSFYKDARLRRITSTINQLEGKLVPICQEGSVNQVKVVLG